VGTRSGGVPDAVEDGQTGVLVKEDDPEAASQALIRILTDRQYARWLGQSGQQRASTRDWLGYGARMIDIYKAACTGRRGPGGGSKDEDFGVDG